MTDNPFIPFIKLPREVAVGGVSTTRLLLAVAKLVETVIEDGPLEVSDNSGVESPNPNPNPIPDRCSCLCCNPLAAAFNSLWVL